ncbi:hypothetical protein SLI_5528 [Streptomyces lividans 1326]|uniref:Uncharacterized protein n=1 Tax=Streptomyces lividans 1326 TaxID=1200984 RepID=A0A7U9DU64_STRLI|nr:hypothetical protein SLI_5528 [Streptomyces lividans 1326]
MLAYEFVHGGHGAERTWRYGQRSKPATLHSALRLRSGRRDPRKHPRAAAPERDPQPSRHRSPEQHRPWGVRSRSAEG